ncbi:RagB/SusD family nutrient uptake outer membrane protein [Weeksellaceae bacterium A-14]
MKRLIYLNFITLSLIGFTTSCDNKLDEELELYSESSTDYTSAEAAKGALVGAYTSFQSVGWEQIPLIAVRGDDVNAGGLGDQPTFADTDNFIYDNNNWMYNSLWKEWYQDIVQITAQIEELEKFRAGGVDSALIDQYEAECKTLRAFMTLEISRVWGEVIVMENLDQTTLTLKDKDAVMTWVSDQMDEAIPNLPDMRPNQRTDLKGGITKYTALAVKAMANLELGNYQEVADATGSIISSGKFSLYSDFYELFKIPGKLADENLLEIQYSDFGTASGQSQNHLWAFYGPTSWTPVVASATAGWGFYEPSLKWIKFMLDRGEKTRLQTSVLFTNRGITKIKEDSKYATLPSWISNTTPDGDVINDYSRAMFASGKHYLPSDQLTAGRTDYGSNKNYIVIRYAEILLMYAEAVTRGASATAGSADNAVNLVRQRAGLSTISGVTADQVMDEKFAELGMEWGVRYYDMVRLGKTNELSYDGRTFTMEKRYLPYPLAQLDYINSLKK